MILNFHGNPHVDWNYKTEPEPVACQGFPEKRCSWPRGKVLGGCSVINGMMYTRGTPEGMIFEFRNFFTLDFRENSTIHEKSLSFFLVVSSLISSNL